MEQLINVECDLLAKQKLEEVLRTDIPPYDPIDWMLDWDAI